MDVAPEHASHTPDAEHDVEHGVVPHTHLPFRHTWFAGQLVHDPQWFLSVLRLKMQSATEPLDGLLHTAMFAGHAVHTPAVVWEQNFVFRQLEAPPVMEHWHAPLTHTPEPVPAHEFPHEPQLFWSEVTSVQVLAYTYGGM